MNNYPYNPYNYSNQSQEYNPTALFLGVLPINRFSAKYSCS